VRPRDAALTPARIGFAATAVVAMTYQFSAPDNTLPTFSHGNFFSFYTIESNILAAGCSSRPRSRAAPIGQPGPTRCEVQ
jgi:hypothetical protein